MANNYGAFSEKSYPKGNNSGAYQESKKVKFSPSTKKTSSTKKTVPNKNVKVSQSEIDSIKKLGMKKSLELVKMNKGAEQAGAVASFAEGVRRMYGETRYQNAVYTPKASPGPVGSASNVREGRSTAKKTGPKANEQNRNPVKPAMTQKQKAQKELAQSRAAKFDDPVSKRFPGRFGNSRGN